jgi:glycosyltransferase involved in cell wall biosynthesis
VEHLRAQFIHYRDSLLPLRIWMFSSTSRGGGVAEMLPRIICLMRELGMSVQWLVVDSEDAELKARFFSLTKHLHNGIHGDGVPLEDWGGCGMERLSRLHKRNLSANDLFAAAAAAAATAADDNGPLTGEGEERADAAASAALLQQRQRDENIACLRAMYESFQVENAESFFRSFCPDPDPDRDLFVIHDPQPAGLLAHLRARCPGVAAIWRCHIGLDVENDATRSAWAFLDPYIVDYDVCVFSTPEYVRQSVRSRSAVVNPGIAPLAPKNKELSAFDITQILLRAGLLDHQQRHIVERRGCELMDPPFADRARIYRTPAPPPAAAAPSSDAVAARLPAPISTVHHLQSIAPALATSPTALSPVSSVASSPVSSPQINPLHGGGAEHPSTAPAPCDCICCVLPRDGIPFLHRPIVTQISRWDRLKGWKPLILAWADLKSRPDYWVELLATNAELLTPGARRVHDPARHRKMLDNALLVLAGPDPKFVVDDPEGLEVLLELRALYDALPPAISRDIKLVELPMSNVVENALIVNAIQRASMVVVQNSLREGFGLTCAEAMVKRTAVVGTEQACGLRAQITHLVDGVLVQGSPEDPANVAAALNIVLGDDVLRDEVAVNAQKRATDCFLVYAQLEQWLRVVVSLLRARDAAKAGAGGGLEAGTDEAQLLPPPSSGRAAGAGGGSAGAPPPPIFAAVPLTECMMKGRSGKGSGGQQPAGEGEPHNKGLGR